MSVPADLLDFPRIVYGNNQAIQSNPWDLRGNTRAVVPCTGTALNPKLWTLVHVNAVNDRREDIRNLNAFVHEMSQQLQRFGMDFFRFQPIGLPVGASPDWGRHEIVLNNNAGVADQLLNGFNGKGLANMAFTVVLLQRRDTTLYPIVKKVADMRLDLNTICCVRKLTKITREYKIQSDGSILGNMKVKLNLKSSPNTADRGLGSPLRLLNTKTMIVGMDVVSTRLIRHWPD